MTPQTLLQHLDSGQLWPSAPSDVPGFDAAAAYRGALAVRALRMARGEVPQGYKIGFTNRSIWPRYGVFAPIWGTVWDTTVTHCDGEGSLSLDRTAQPRLEPEAVFGMAATPPAGASLEDLFACIAWVAPGFEVVQSHLPDWKFRAADTMADSGLHARLLVGRKLALREVAASANELDAILAACRVSLRQGNRVVDQGQGANVLDSPLRALHHFLAELRQCPGATDLQPGDVITTGTWTDAWPVRPGEVWTGDFSAPLHPLTVSFK
ncbi:MAG: fumarylacetoacetate hydrolase family protein [Pseudomonadota bacterium]